VAYAALERQQQASPGQLAAAGWDAPSAEGGRAGGRLLVAGGECGVEVAPVAALAARHGRLAVLWLDAHADLNTVESSPSGRFHGMPARLPPFVAPRRLGAVLLC
jgi:arginase family enzyme